MSIMQQAQRYFDAWNAHDAAGIVAAFAPGGTYQDPTTPGPLTGEAIGHYAAGLWAAFPDLRFELTHVAPAGEGFAGEGPNREGPNREGPNREGPNREGIVSAQWLMRGTNHGSMLGLPPTGKAIELPGADFVVVEESGIRSVTGYFDSAQLPRQLGLQSIVQPETLGPFAFGTSVAVQSGRQGTPGALSMTSLVLRDLSEREIVRKYSRQIAPEMLRMNGFISFTGIAVGSRMLTLSAWDSPEDPRQLLRGGTHKDAMRHFYSDGYYCGGVTSVWEPVRFSYMARCGTCNKMNHANEPITHCSACGAPLSLPENTW
jgi:steroid delta-isomerase-like uncharacterized protein